MPGAAGGGNGRCRHRAAGASGALPVPPAGVDPAGTRPVPSRPALMGGGPVPPAPGIPKFPVFPVVFDVRYSRNPPRCCCGSSSVVPSVTLSAPSAHQPPQHPWCLFCPSRVPPAPLPLVFPSHSPCAFPASPVQGSGSRGCWWVAGHRSTPGCPHAMAPQIPALWRGTNIVPREEGPLRHCSPQLTLYPSVPKHSTAGRDPMERDTISCPTPMPARS